MFRDTCRRFFETEVQPHHAQWEEEGVVPKSVWRKAGELGLLCMDVPEEYGGAGADWLHNVIAIEEQWRVFASGPGFSLHNDITSPYVRHFGTEDQKKRWLPKMVSGEMITAIAMTEPGTGSDLQSVRTSAVCDTVVPQSRQKFMRSQRPLSSDRCWHWAGLPWVKRTRSCG